MTSVLRPLHCLLPGRERIALLLLNPNIHQIKEQFNVLWGNAVFRVAVDGGANSIYDADNSLVPDIVTGDFDSIRPEVKEYYTQKGCTVTHTDDQDYTDFTKSLAITTKLIREKSLDVSCIVALFCMDNRLDHIFGNMVSLYDAKQMTDLPVYTLAGKSLACLLSKGKHTLEVDTGIEGEYCGLIPLGKPCHVTTTGLKWNLPVGDDPLQFGGLVSTSNGFDGSGMVTIETDNPLLWTMETT
ncbi:unnamed protein product [Owenia fusiformis]|uniref:Thiamine pyrophosphokinase n=1 Tax=Owenia fusiformis TaxID=6347 RepID=A0A8S4N4S1_OWEFU|nr:unnamed protein product [Owenia fusiformis]